MSTALISAAALLFLLKGTATSGCPAPGVTNCKDKTNACTNTETTIAAVKRRFTSSGILWSYLCGNRFMQALFVPTVFAKVLKVWVATVPSVPMIRSHFIVNLSFIHISGWACLCGQRSSPLYRPIPLCRFPHRRDNFRARQIECNPRMLMSSIIRRVYNEKITCY